MLPQYDVIVVGAGHAGCEAAAAAANMGCSTLLVTMDMTKMAQMSCNPAMGGVAKGQIIREIDALGGYSGIVSDRSMIQFRMLNRSKGPALWSPRSQNDRQKFTIVWRELLEDTENLDFWQDSVVGLIIDNGNIKGIKTKLGISIFSKSVILTNGTFENGLMHIGRTKIKGGRAGDMASVGISDQLKEYGFEVGRMKTGTPPRLDGRTIDFSKMLEQKGDVENKRFSYLENEVDYSNHMSCWITYTNLDVHEDLRTGLLDSPMYNGTIKSIGPRYCPSIEDKIHTFASKDSHQLFLEPEGLNTNEYYLNGFSSSLPWEVQLSAMHKIPGLENVKIFRPGYAIEYDYYPPTQLFHSLETRKISNLYFAGQINGTTGYEEAGAQGLMAGINAALKIQKKGEFVLGRDQAYIGVLIDDLISKGVDEPYRMFTSRAEYRLLLRQDDADERLTDLSFNIGLAKKERKVLLDEKLKIKNDILEFLKTTSIVPAKMNVLLKDKGTSPIKQKLKAVDLLRRPQISIFELSDYVEGIRERAEMAGGRAEEILESVEITIKYEGYIKREKDLAEKIKRLNEVKILDSIDIGSLKSISTEARHKLKKQKPKTIGEASKISGVSPADISVLLLYMGR
ncbi:MAG: tRNA uridine-5-carboxymethylaminomethyl(34) synthesis enzyme MnmG [Bacteroidales bacterium]|nr:tRNA uridine-5-carboxymethylaminomethyl(34) synthesis enzyme MnmG [Bacteroidales bacterium]MCF8389669.1 tRNA uridine-5-carboxymethylaminomethyl(34) synthesis enzyme MnmG [Bacteroidales bacterium]